MKILQTPSKVELERQAVERTRRSSQSRLALPNPHHQHDKVPLPAPEGELFGLPTDSARAPLKYLNFIDRSKLRAICRAARNLLDFDLAHVVVHFTYETEFFDSIPRCTRSGRVMNNGQAVHGRRLLGFLTYVMPGCSNSWTYAGHRHLTCLACYYILFFNWSVKSSS